MMQGLTEAIRREARKLLDAGKVDVVIGFTQGTLPLRAAPFFARKTAEVERLVWNSFCENNLARYLRGLRNKRVAIVAKGCDTRSIVALITEHQVERDRIYIIGVPCQGMVDRRIMARRAPGEILAAREENQEIFIEGDDFSLRLPRSEVLYRSCAVCTHPNPVLYDVLVAEPVAVWTDDPYAYVRAIEEKSPSERAAYFVSEAQRCIRCYACRQACPMCYCEECFVDHATPRWIESGVTPAGLQGWQIGRAYHLTGRCVDCGACERACPMEIDLVYLNGKLNKDVRELYGFETGLVVGELPPLAVFRPDEGPDFSR
ncbi:MAG: 4Fe-4S dicluster domain-containing protein [Anaerolineae bacterium]